jgi:ribonuclease-3
MRFSGLVCVYHKEMHPVARKQPASPSSKLASKPDLKPASKPASKSASKPVPSLARLELALGSTFARPELLVQALTHRTFSEESHQAHRQAMPDLGQRPDNQRLEFLGDAVLGLVVAELLFQSHPEWQEGELSQMRVQFVNRSHLGKVALAIKLGPHLRLGAERDRSGGRNNEYILANAMEAVIAAMYLDAGGELAPVRRFVQSQILGSTADKLADELVSGGALGNYKSALQLHLQAAGLGMPVYSLLSATGPDHQKHFESDVRVKASDGEIGPELATGGGISRKKSEQEAARRALALLQNRPQKRANQAAAEIPEAEPMQV